LRRWSNSLYSHRDFGASLTAVLLLSVGLGGATLLFTALDRLLLHPLNLPHPERLVRAAIKRPKVTVRSGFSYDTYQAAKHMKGFRDVAVEADFDTALTTDASSQRLFAQMVSGTYFRLLGATPVLGRSFGPDDERISANSVPVVLSYGLWLSRFGRAPSVLGTVVYLQGQPFTIVGVMPQRFYGTSIDDSPDLWLPFSAQPLLSKTSLSDSQSDRIFTVIGRLRDGSSITQAEAELAAFYQAQQSADRTPNPGQLILEPIGQGAFALHDQFAYALSLLMWGLLVFLVMMCANVAGLLLVRAARREKETAIRVALGASRHQLIGRGILESIGLGLAGASGGLLVAGACGPLLHSLLPVGRSPLPISLVPSFGVGLMAVALALGISLIFGTIPAWLSSRIAPEQVLRSTTSTRRAGLLSRSLLTLQTGLTFVLLVGTGLLIHTFHVLRDTNPGFDTEHLVAFTLNSNTAGDPRQLSPTLPTDLEQRVQDLPGVRSASLSSGALMHRIGLKGSVALPGHKIAKEDFLNTTSTSVTSAFFDTLRIPMLGGRGFSAAEEQSNGSNPMVSKILPVVINEAFARLLFPDQTPLGKTFGWGAPGQVATEQFRVIGLAGDSKYRSLREAMLPIFYTPLGPRLGSNSDFYLFLYARTQGSPATVIGAVKNALFHLNPRLPFFDVVTMHDEVQESLWQERLLAVLSLAFALVSIFMATMGLYGLLSYDTNQRTREFGIRTAVGAQKRDLATLLLQDVTKIVLPGLAAGLVACLLLVRVMTSALYGIHPLDAASFAGAFLLVVVLGLVACWLPMRRAMNVAPAVVLRDE
jgi:predicted permease